MQPRRALTLIETLAVVLLVGVVTAAVGVGMGRMGDDAAMRAFAARWNELDARARLLAQTTEVGVLRLEFDAERRAVFVHHLGDAILTADVPQEMNIMLFLEGAETTLITFDRAGRTPDYELRLSSAERSMSWHIHGLTGAMQRMEAAP